MYNHFSPQFSFIHCTTLLLVKRLKTMYDSFFFFNAKHHRTNNCLIFQEMRLLFIWKTYHQDIYTFLTHTGFLNFHHNTVIKKKKKKS